MTESTLQVNIATQDLKATQDRPKLVGDYRLRLWPAVLIVIAMWLVRWYASLGEMSSSKFFFGKITAPVAATILLNLWWLFGSRIRWFDRLAGCIVFAAVCLATPIITGKKNFPPMGLIIYAIPVITTLWVAWLVLTMKLPWSFRLAGVFLVFLATGAWFSMLRVEGMDGNLTAKINWRWTPTSEAMLLSELKTQVPPRSTATTDPVQPKVLTMQPGDWPCFRGPLRDSRLAGVRIATDWEKSPPKEMWRHRIGPGWSSVTVIGDRLFTQEQRGDEELVVCYNAGTGEEIWKHHDPTRFEEVVAGAGPRGTPTFHEGRLLTMGASGQLNCLDAATGERIWGVDVLKDAKADLPQWGYASSPLVCQGIVSVFAGGPDSKAVMAYRIDSGEFAWASGESARSYCSVQHATIDGVEQLLMATAGGLVSFEPITGAICWEHRWKSQLPRVVQPAILSETDLLLGAGMPEGTRRLSIRREGDQWSIKEIWTTTAIKPYFNDFVVQGDYLYGFDGKIFMCVSLDDGKMQWRERGYGNGQVLLSADDALLLILSEQGEVALVEAKPERHKEIARIKVIEGKTWNHPVIAHGKLFVRNAEEIACFQLPENN